MADDHDDQKSNGAKTFARHSLAVPDCYAANVALPTGSL
jgi:hypothetical protein